MGEIAGGGEAAGGETPGRETSDGEMADARVDSVDGCCRGLKSSKVVTFVPTRQRRSRASKSLGLE